MLIKKVENMLLKYVQKTNSASNKNKLCIK